MLGSDVTKYGFNIVLTRVQGPGGHGAKKKKKIKSGDHLAGGDTHETDVWLTSRGTYSRTAHGWNIVTLLAREQGIPAHF